jgi:ATP-dependent DNA helicase RecQ
MTSGVFCVLLMNPLQQARPALVDVDGAAVEIYTASVNVGTDLLPTLRRYWGYDSFRPLQERIARSLLEGHDTCVVMPTGGGKSLCYQLPAAMLSGQTVIVVSPLIALMQDQVAQLAQLGIASAVLNSSVAGNEQSAIMSQACKGEYRLLYLSPERLARTDTIAWLRQVPISFFVIDEAHCISEWGHEFRPDYRQLSSLRLHFPDRPIAAFTASATRRVRHDIIDQLQLRNPDKYIASFHRPNLRYVVKECEGHMQLDLLVTALRHYAGSSIIVYAPTIARVEETVDFLEEQGIPAIAYHGQMENDVRRRNQERWMSDEIRVLVGTIAFGLGINKSAVRAVIHLSLPKSIEQYYQEAGRAGRDGLPADCILLWQKRDAGLLAHFIKQIADPAETERAWQRYYGIRDFVESDRCRHSQICSHFGETSKWKSCGACDVCGCHPEWLRQSAGVERPKRTKAASHARALAALSQPADTGGAPNAASDLRDYLREWRRITANWQGIPAFVVMHDSSLEEVCWKRPASLAELADVSGFGERKVELYGRPILDALARFRQGARAAAAPQQKAKPAQETMRLLAEGRTFDEIAKIRGRQLRTIVSMVANLVARGEIEFQPAWVDSDKQKNIEAACAHLGLERLGPLKEAVAPEITYEDIRLVVARLRRQHARR